LTELVAAAGFSEIRSEVVVQLGVPSEIEIAIRR
jgi:hypothetical protein